MFALNVQNLLNKKKLPKYALANNLWLGQPVPIELLEYTLVENPTIARLRIKTNIIKIQTEFNSYQNFVAQYKIKGNIITCP